MNAWLQDVFDGAAVPDAAAEAAKLCLNELVANVILYGGATRIGLTMTVEDGRLRMTVEDDGAAFDPLAAPEVAAMTGLDDARVGGFGIKLFRENSHSARYERSGGRNRLSFTCG